MSFAPDFVSQLQALTSPPGEQEDYKQVFGHYYNVCGSGLTVVPELEDTDKSDPHYVPFLTSEHRDTDVCVASQLKGHTITMDGFTLDTNESLRAILTMIARARKGHESVYTAHLMSRADSDMKGLPRPQSYQDEYRQLGLYNHLLSELRFAPFWKGICNPSQNTQAGTSEALEPADTLQAEEESELREQIWTDIKSWDKRMTQFFAADLDIDGVMQQVRVLNDRIGQREALMTKLEDLTTRIEESPKKIEEAMTKAWDGISSLRGSDTASQTSQSSSKPTGSTLLEKIKSTGRVPSQSTV